MNEDAPRKDGLSRGSFLKGVLGIAGAGVGVIAAASKADAKTPLFTTCCHTTAAPCPGCAGPQLNYKCYSDCYAGYTCICHSNVGNCFTFKCAG